MADRYEGKIPTMEYKTLRYPGHAHIMEAIRELGLLEMNPVDVKGVKVAPRDLFVAAVGPRLTKPEGKVDVMEYKTLRYPGHVAIMRPIRELGLLGLKPLEVKGQTVVPRDVFIAAVHPKLYKPQGRDLVALQVQVSGRKEGRPQTVRFRLIDHYDPEHGISAMMRTTGYSLSITGQMQADGRIAEQGVRTPDEAVPFRAYVDELARRGVRIEEL
jgi:lysine 6-dehydrogenase